MKLKAKIKKKIKKLSTKNYFFRKVYNKLKIIKRKISYKKLSKKIDIEENMIIFAAFAGRTYTCSPKAIYEYMLTQPEFENFKFVWAFGKVKDKKIEEDPRTEVVKFDSKKFYKRLAQAKYWIFNFKTEEYFYKKEGQIFIQCWHGTPLKRLGCDIKVEKGNRITSLKEIHKSYRQNAKKYDYFISPSAFCTEKFTSAFDLKEIGKEDIVIETGYPRNDFLYNYKKEDVEQIKEKLNLPRDKKIILYAPTFRDNQHTLGKGHTYKLGIDLEKLKKELSEEYIVLMRLHYLISNKIDISEFEGFAYDLSKYDDINELYVISDMLVTDYSSVFFDYANLRRPILFYMYDLDEYKNNIRDFYIELEELPGPIIKKEDELVNNIKDVKNIVERYNDKYIEFSKKYNSLDDGNAARRVVEACIK